VQISLLVLDNLFSICLGITRNWNMLQVLLVNWYAFQVYAQSIFYKAMNLHTSVVALWEHFSGWEFIIFCPTSFFLASCFLYFLFVSFVINRLCDEGSMGSTSVLKRFCFLLPHQSKHRKMVANISESASLDGWS